jgi:hypothetical protein
MQIKINWYKVEFYDKNSLTIRHRTVKVKLSKYGDLKDLLRAKLRTKGFRNIELLQWYIMTTNYLR